MAEEWRRTTTSTKLFGCEEKENRNVTSWCQIVVAKQTQLDNKKCYLTSWCQIVVTKQTIGQQKCR